MLRTFLSGKIHRATVTDANLEYVGSITIDPLLLEAAGILPGEQVCVVNLENGARYETYAVEGRRGSGEVVVNGGGARICLPGDIVIILAYLLVDTTRESPPTPSLVFVDHRNMPMALEREP